MTKNLRETYFFEIPVYRSSPEQYNAEIEELRAKHAKLYSGAFQSPEPWRFNQIIGYLRLFVDFGRNVVKAEYWDIEQKRILRKLGKKKFMRRPGNAIEVWFLEKDSSSEIYAHILDALEELQKDDRFKNLYIDLSMFREIGPFFDWRSFLDS